MTEPLHVLVWGTAEQGACAYFRGHLYDEAIRQHGIEFRHLKGLGTAGDMAEVYEEFQRTGRYRLDTSDLDWADVIMLRRYYNTGIKCLVDGCRYMTTDPDEAVRHGHPMKPQDGITRTIWPAFADLREKAIVYDTDDDHFDIQPWNGYYPDVKFELGLIEEMARRADLLTVSTPSLGRIYGTLNPRVRVIRNALDPDTYVRTASRPPGDKPRLVYYGSTARLRDYAGYPDQRGKWRGGYARRAIDELAPLLRRVFIGTDPGTELLIGQLFDEQTPYINHIATFNRALADSHADIGVAPLGGDAFDRCKSELHWLEYSVVGAAFIGERFNGEGPYQVVRHGVDGLLARGAQEWYDAVRFLAREPQARADMAAAARERVLAEYDYRTRAAEWAAAFRWAAEHPGIGRREALAA